MNQSEKTNVDKCKALFLLALNQVGQQLFPDLYKPCEWELEFMAEDKKRPWSFYLPRMGSDVNQNTVFSHPNNYRQEIAQLPAKEAGELIAIKTSLILMESIAQAEETGQVVQTGLFDFSYDTYHGLKRIACQTVIEIID